MPLQTVEPQRLYRQIAEHEMILAAICAHDGPDASAAMHAHMDKSHTRFSASWCRAKTTRSQAASNSTL